MTAKSLPVPIRDKKEVIQIMNIDAHLDAPPIVVMSVAKARVTQDPTQDLASTRFLDLRKIRPAVVRVPRGQEEVHEIEMSEDGVDADEPILEGPFGEPAPYLALGPIGDLENVRVDPFQIAQPRRATNPDVVQDKVAGLRVDTNVFHNRFPLSLMRSMP